MASVTTSTASQISDLQAKASQLEAQIQTLGEQISALGQQYDEAMNQVHATQSQIAATQAKIAQDEQLVAHDQVTLRRTAVNTYMEAGSITSANPLFVSNESAFGAEQEYSQVVEGNLNTDVAKLHSAQALLNIDKANLQNQLNQEQQAANAAANAQAQANREQAQLEADLSQAKGQLGTLISQQTAAQNAAITTQRLQTQRLQTTNTNVPPPPSSGGAGAIAVRAAESQLGVPYVWGGETPGVGFDCSGLTAWAWGQAGVPLPHYSGAQYADSTPVPLSDLQPGDLLFYGPGGSQHVAMYVGGGQMIEAPYTGAVVWITPLRLGDGFVGAGRP